MQAMHLFARQPHYKVTHMNLKLLRQNFNFAVEIYRNHM